MISICRPSLGKCPGRVFPRSAPLWLLALALGVAVLWAGAAGAEGRTIHVSAGFKGGNGHSAERPLPSISAALTAAGPGDTISVAAGRYEERLTVPVRGLRIVGATQETEAGLEPLVTIAAPGDVTNEAPLVVDAHDTVWSGIRFGDKWGRLLELRGFTGAFSHCRFDLALYPSSIDIYGGKPTFMASTFVSARATAASVQLFGGGEGSEVLAAYCLFQDFSGGAFVLKGEQNLTAVNCVFAHCGHFLIRDEGVAAEAYALNTVFYLITAPQIARQFPGAPKVILDTCLYTPAQDRNFHWDAKSLQEQDEIESRDCVTASPRFKGGKLVFMNLGIDDARNTPVWDGLAAKLNEYPMPITLAIDIFNMNEEWWKMAARRVDEGHEVGTHTATHSSLLAKHVVRLGYYDQNLSSAELTIDETKLLRIEADGQEIFRLPLAGENGGKGPTLGQLVDQLENAGIRAHLASSDFRDIPAVLLAETHRQDIFFPAYLTAVNLDTEAYQMFSLGPPRQVVEENLKRLGAVNWQCLVALCPFGEFANELLEKLVTNGYLAARGRRGEPPDRGFEFDVGFDTANVFPVRDVSSNQVTLQAPLDSDEEVFRVFLDYVKHSGGAISFYSHSHEELSRDAWDIFFDLLAADEMVKVMRFADIVGELDKHCDTEGDGVYTCEPGQYPNVGEVSYQPRDDSPLIRAGKPTPFKTNFAGRELPEGTRPNIGLY